MNYTTDRVLSDLESELKSTRDTWSPEQWQVAAERLGWMFEFTVDELIRVQRKKRRGRPPRVRNALALPIQKRRPGRPREYTDAVLRTLLAQVEEFREVVRRKTLSAKVTDKDAIEAMLMAYRKEDGFSQHRVRRAIPRFQKLYSRAKSRIAKL